MGPFLVWLLLLPIAHGALTVSLHSSASEAQNVSLTISSTDGQEFAVYGLIGGGKAFSLTSASSFGEPVKVQLHSGSWPETSLKVESSLEDGNTVTRTALLNSASTDTVILGASCDTNPPGQCPKCLLPAFHTTPCACDAAAEYICQNGRWVTSALPDGEFNHVFKSEDTSEDSTSVAWSFLRPKMSPGMLFFVIFAIGSVAFGAFARPLSAFAKPSGCFDQILPSSVKSGKLPILPLWDPTQKTKEVHAQKDRKANVIVEVGSRISVSFEEHVVSEPDPQEGAVAADTQVQLSAAFPQVDLLGSTRRSVKVLGGTYAELATSGNVTPEGEPSRKLAWDAHAGHVRLQTEIFAQAVDRKFDCPLCNKSYSRKFNLARHMQTHRGPLPFECHCSLRFSTKAEYDEHFQLSHTGSKPYKCQLCPKAFEKKRYLIGHRKIHSTFRPWKCPACDKGFIRRTNLLRHVKTHGRGIEVPRSLPKTSATSTSRGVRRPRAQAQRKVEVEVKEEPSWSDSGSDADFEGYDAYSSDDERHKTSHAGIPPPAPAHHFSPEPANNLARAFDAPLPSAMQAAEIDVSWPYAEDDPFKVSFASDPQLVVLSSGLFVSEGASSVDSWDQSDSGSSSDSDDSSVLDVVLSPFSETSTDSSPFGLSDDHFSPFSALEGDPVCSPESNSSQAW